MTALIAAAAAGLAAWSAGTARPSSAARAGLGPPPAARAVLAATTTGVAVVCCRLVRLPVGALAALAVAVVIAGRLAHRASRQRRRAALDADVVTFCFAVAAELRTGRMPSDAITATVTQLAPLAQGMTAVARAAGHGAAVDAELYALADEASSRRLETVAAVWTAAAATGARMADVLERVAVAFTAEDEAMADLDALAAGPRATAMVLCLLPLVGIALAVTMGAHPLALLLHSGFGGLLLCGAALLDAGGLLWVRAVTRQALRG